MSAAWNGGKVHLLVIVGCEKGDREPFVIGAFNQQFMSDLPEEDYDAQIQRLKETWTGEPEAYDFRELRVAIPFVAIEDAFQLHTIQGEVDDL